MNKIINIFLENGYLLSFDLIKLLENLNYKEFLTDLNRQKSKPLFLNPEIKKALDNKKDFFNFNWHEFDKSRVLFEKQRDKSRYNLFLDILNQTFKKNEISFDKKQEILDAPETIDSERENDNLIILKNYDNSVKERNVETFINHYRHRYNVLKDILILRQELQNTISIDKSCNKKEQENISIIGLVSDKRTTKNGNLLFTLEDLTGITNVVVSKNKKILFNKANDILLDEVIGITGLSGDRIIFVDKIYFPEVPQNNTPKKHTDDIYVAFTSDTQVGNKLFYEKNFMKFIDWLNLKYGNETQREIAKKVKYLFIPGDIVEGVGVYPGQENDLIIPDLYKQYTQLAEYLSKIRKDIKIILSPGNHDAIQIAEPQPVFDKKTASPLYDLPNVYFTTNPSLVNICSTKDFQGFDILIYHGFSFPYIAENVESIRKAGRIERPDLIMKFQLQKRHLAPSHASTLYLPGQKEDPLIISKVPDFFISGHLHKTMVSNYNGVTMMNCSCWVDQTEDQEKRGIIPDPCKVILINLKTREIKILNFKENE